MLALAQRGADGLTRLSALIGTLGLLTEVVVILIDVVGRYFGHPLTGAQDISQMAMVVLVFGGMALCDKVGGHISVDLFENAMPRWMVRTGDIVSALIGATIFLGIAWTTLDSAALSKMLNLATNIIGLPKVWFSISSLPPRSSPRLDDPQGHRPDPRAPAASRPPRQPQARR